MNIIGMRQEKRARQISQIMESVKKAEAKGEVNFKDVVMAAMSNLNISNRTAREYVEVAFYRLGINEK